MPLVVFAELLFGVAKSREANRARLERFAAGVRVLPFDLALATRYATVRAAVERKGRPKTAALKDGAIEGLVVEDWFDSGAP